MKHISVTLTLLLALLFLGCSSDKESLQVETNLTTNSEDIVELQASGALAYTWRQISGTPVILINANSATPSFIAPDVVTQETLVFELEAVTAQIQGESITLKKQVQVTVHPKDTGVESTPDTDATVQEGEDAEAGDTHMHSTSGEVEREEHSNTPTATHEVNSTDMHSTSPEVEREDTPTTQETNSTTQSTPTSKTQTSAALKSLKLTLEKNSLNVDETTTLKVVATYSDNTTKDVTNQVAWNLSDATAAQIIQKSLHAKKDTNIFLQAKLNSVTSNAVALEIYKEINGHRLPPEPDPAINSATLLGVDSNDNGARDDVERKILLEIPTEVKKQVYLQDARRYQRLLADPNLMETAKKEREGGEELSDKNFGCITYLFREKGINAYGSVKFLEEATFNTKERILKYIRYNDALSGGVYWTEEKYVTESSCEFNVTEALEMDQ